MIVMKHTKYKRHTLIAFVFVVVAAAAAMYESTLKTILPDRKSDEQKLNERRVNFNGSNAHPYIIHRIC